MKIKQATTVALSAPLAFNASGNATTDKSAASLPNRFKILDWGDNVGRTTGAEIHVTSKTVSVLAANQELMAHETVPLDYEHQSVKGHKEYKEPPHHYAAHGKIECVEGEGVYFTAAEYTPNGVEFALSYKDVSAVAYADDEGNVIFIQSVALTQNGDVDGMEFTAALTAQLSTPEKTEPSTMDKNENEKNKYRDMLITLLGLEPAEGEDTITDEAIAGAIASNASKAEKKETKTADDKPAESKEMVAMSARIDKMEKDSIVSAGVALGKVIPLSAEQIQDMDIAVLSSMIDKLPADQINMSKKAAEEKPATKVALSADEKGICERLQISEEEFLASK